MHPSRRPLLAILGLVTVPLLLASCGDDGGDNSAPFETGRGSGGTDTSAPATGSAQDTERKVIVTSAIDLEVQDVRSAYLEVGRMARAIGGFVADARITGENGEGEASVRVRIPSEKHDEFMASLRAFGGGTVLDETTNSREVTEQFTDLESHLRNVQRAEIQYLDLLKQARTVDEILAVSAKLDAVRDDIERTQGQLNLLGDLVDFATVTVTLSEPSSSAREGIPGPREVFSDAWDAAINVALVLLNVATVLAVVAIWLALPAAVGFGAWWWITRRASRRSSD